MLHHCGHTFLCSLRWPHGWMHTPLWTHLSLSLRWPHGWMLHHCGHTFLYREMCLMGGCYTIVDTPFSESEMTSWVDVHNCGHTFLCSHLTSWVDATPLWTHLSLSHDLRLQRKVCPHGWMLHHWVISDYRERCVHNGVASTFLISDYRERCVHMGVCIHPLRTHLSDYSLKGVSTWVELHHCGHTFLCSLMWPHGWMLHHWDTPFSVLWDDLMGGCYTIVDILSDYREMTTWWMLHHCGHTFLCRKVCPQWCSIHHCGHTFLCSLRWPHGWMLHHCGHTFLCTQRKVCSTIVDTPFSEFRSHDYRATPLCVTQWSVVWSTHEVMLHHCGQRKVCPQWCSSTHEVISDSEMTHMGGATPLWTHLSL